MVEAALAERVRKARMSTVCHQVTYETEESLESVRKSTSFIIIISTTEGIAQKMGSQRGSVKFVMIVIIKLVIYPEWSRYLGIIQGLYARYREEAALFTTLPTQPVAAVQKIQANQPQSKRSFTTPPSSRKPRHHIHHPSTAH